MVTLKDFMETVDYRITEGSDYTWNCFGDNPYTLSAWNGDHNGWSFNITFDTGTQEIYVVEACDYKRNRAYRLLNPNWAAKYREYAQRENPEYVDQAWDGVDYVDLETDDDWLEKARAIVDDVDYDTRVSIPLNIPEDQLLVIFKAAHERDMTFNQFVEEAVRGFIAEANDDPDAFRQRAERWKHEKDLL